MWKWVVEAFHGMERNNILLNLYQKGVIFSRLLAPPLLSWFHKSMNYNSLHQFVCGTLKKFSKSLPKEGCSELDRGVGLNTSLYNEFIVLGEPHCF